MPPPPDTFSRPARNRRVDALRLAAAIAVVALHVSYTDADPRALLSELRPALRWAVPFFLLVTGWYLPRGEHGLPLVRWSFLLRVAFIAVLADLAYAPLWWRQFEAGDKDWLSLASGTWYHLWYLHSLLFGLVALRVAPALLAALRIGSAGRPALHVLAILLLAAYWWADMLVHDGGDGGRVPAAARMLHGLALVWLGFVLGQAARREEAGRWLVGATGPALALGGLALIALEAWAMLRLGLPFWNRELPAGCVPMAAGMVLWAMSARAGSGAGAGAGSEAGSGTEAIDEAGLLARIGSSYALFVYLAHPAVLEGWAALGIWWPASTASMLAATAAVVMLCISAGAVLAPLWRRTMAAIFPQPRPRALP